jgi:hypothetical protein
MAFLSTLKRLMIRQSRQAEVLAFRVDVSEISGDTSAGLLEGTNLATISKTGTGDYTITLKRAARRTLVVLGAGALTIDARFQITAIDTDSVRITWEVGGTDTDMDFHITLLSFGDLIQH